MYRALNSAALIADAGHSLSDLVSDVVVLCTWRISRRPPTYRYPYGYGKFESVGSLVVSILLIGGALGIGASTRPNGDLQCSDLMVFPFPLHRLL
jgi:divalent metal cation (Fe/Co/Zn/Cd) transporter